MKNIEELRLDVEDMLLELNDVGFRCKVGKRNYVKIGCLASTYGGHFNSLEITFFNNNKQFSYKDIEETYLRIKYYLMSNGLTETKESEAKPNFYGISNIFVSTIVIFFINSEKIGETHD